MSSTDQENLTNIQNWMQSVLISPELNSAQAKDFINDSNRLTAERHLQIYRQSYIARLRECMKNQFSALAFALGEELFQMFADQYLENYPSGSYTLNDLGKQFPDFLEATRPDDGSEEKESWIDFIIELARFEFSLSEIFDEHAAENFVPADADTPDENLKLIPVFRLFHHTYPVCRYYLDVVNKNAPELPFEEETFCAVTRCDYRLALLEINPAQHYFLEKLAHGESVSKAKIRVIDEFGFDPKNFETVWLKWRENFIASNFFFNETANKSFELNS